MILGDVESPHAHYLSDPLLIVVHTLVCTAPVEMDPFRFSLQNEHCVAGLPFFLTSNNGRSVCVHPETRCPLMQVAQANFLSLMRTILPLLYARICLARCCYDVYGGSAGANCIYREGSVNSRKRGNRSACV